MGSVLRGLLKIRFPEVFGLVDTVWSERLTELAPWIYDAHVVHAKALYDAFDPGDEILFLLAIIDALACAQTGGSPYYRFTNEVFGEMSAEIDEYFTPTTM